MSLIKRVSELLSVSGQLQVTLADLDLELSARLDRDAALPIRDGGGGLLGCRYGGHFHLKGIEGDGKAPAGG